MGADAPGQREAGCEIGLVQVVEKDAADAARLRPVLDIEIVVAPPLVAGIPFGAERGQRRAAGAVEMPRVLGERVIGRQVHAAAEPPDRSGASLLRHEEAHVHVHGGDVRDCADGARARRPSPGTSGRRVPGGRRWQKAAGSAPSTCEKFTPARSNTTPSSITCVTPPPPSGRDHSSRRKARPSIPLRLATIVCCNPVRNCLTAATSTGRRR